MRGAGSPVIALMAYCVAHAKPPVGEVEINVELVAFQIGDSVENIQKALDFLLADDPKSRQKSEGGKRLLKLGDFLYRLVNWQFYRDGTDYDSRRVYWSKKQSERRARIKKGSNFQDVITAGRISEIPTEQEAIASTMTAGIPETFSRHVYSDWASRSGKDASGVIVAWLPYVTKRWSREGIEWRNGKHKGNKSVAQPAGGNF